MARFQRREGGLLGWLATIGRALGTLLFGRVVTAAASADGLRRLYTEHNKVFLHAIRADARLIALAKQLAQKAREAGDPGPLSVQGLILQARAGAQFPAAQRIAHDLGLTVMPLSVTARLRELFYVPPEPTAEKLVLRPFPVADDRLRRLASPLEVHEQRWGTREPEKEEVR